jgi:pentose-5-phosphate-3-epimerase
MSVNPERTEVYSQFTEEDAAVGANARRAGLDFRIEVDGGVAMDTVGGIVRAGAELLVAATHLGHGEPKRMRVNCWMRARGDIEPGLARILKQPTRQKAPRTETFFH